jgi:hypothetical protein
MTGVVSATTASDYGDYCREEDAKWPALQCSNFTPVTELLNAQTFRNRLICAFARQP